MEIHIDKNIIGIINKQEPKTRKLFLEMFDKFSPLMRSLQEALDRNEFDTALLAKDTILQLCAALNALTMQFHRLFGIHDDKSKVWSDEDVKALIDEAQRLYGVATDLVVSKFQALSLKSEEHKHLK